MAQKDANEKYGSIVNMGRTLGSLIDLERELSQGVNISEMYNVPLQINSITTRNGREGDYIMIDAIDLRNDEALQLRTGGAIIMNILKKVDHANAFPVHCAFYPAPNSNAKLIRDIQPSDFE